MIRGIDLDETYDFKGINTALFLVGMSFIGSVYTPDSCYKSLLLDANKMFLTLTNNRDLNCARTSE